MKQVLLVEDDLRLSQLIEAFLEEHDFSVECMADGRNLLASVKQQTPDIIILDVMLPGEDGFALCQKLRPFYSGPLLFMTAKSSDFDQVLGLELGADDYVIKPVEPRVLLARINALMRRSKEVSNHLQVLKGETIQLTSHEFDMLWKLASNASTLVERETLYTELIGREYDGLDRSADVRISRLRKKLDDNPQSPYRIKTIWGKGFFFVPDAWD
jgi:DNA-binding response OmpR family regulator